MNATTGQHPLETNDWDFYGAHVDDNIWAYRMGFTEPMVSSSISSDCLFDQEQNSCGVRDFCRLTAWLYCSVLLGCTEELRYRYSICMG